MPITLRKLKLTDGDKERRFLQSFPHVENGFHNPAHEEDLADKESFKKWLKKKVDESNGITREGHVPQTIYWVESEGKIVGVGKVRHYLNDDLRHNGGGHIGLGGIAKENRGKGIGTEALRLLIEEARKLGEKDLLITPSENNFGSRRITEKNGGVLEKIIDDPRYPDKRLAFYWIKDKTDFSSFEQ